MIRAVLTGLGACAVVAGITCGLFPYRSPKGLVGPADIVSFSSFTGLRPMGRGYNGPVAWIETAGGWRAMRADELASLPNRSNGYLAIMIEQVSAAAYFGQFGRWPAKPSDAQVWHLCDWQRERGMATAPCEELPP